MSSYEISELLEYRIFADAHNLRFHHNAKIYGLVKAQDIERFQFDVDVNATSRRNRSHDHDSILTGVAHGRTLKVVRSETKSNLHPMPSFMLKLMQEEAGRLAHHCSSGLLPDTEAQETLQCNVQTDLGLELTSNDQLFHEHDVTDGALSQHIDSDANIDNEVLCVGRHNVHTRPDRIEHEQEEDSSVSSGESVLDLEAYLTIVKNPLFEATDMTVTSHHSNNSSEGLSVKPTCDYTAAIEECFLMHSITQNNQALDLEVLAAIERRFLAEDNEGCSTDGHVQSVQSCIQPPVNLECQHITARTESSDESDTTISHLISPSEIRAVPLTTLQTTRSEPHSSVVSTQNSNSRSVCTNLTMTGSNIYGQSHLSPARTETECSAYTRTCSLIEADFCEASEERNPSSLPEHDSGWGGHPIKRVAWNKTAPQLPQRRRRWQSTSILSEQEYDVSSRDTVWEDVRNDDEQRLMLVKDWLSALPLEPITGLDTLSALKTIAEPTMSEMKTGMLDHKSSQLANCEISSTSNESSSSKTRRTSCAVLNCASLGRQTEKHIAKKQCMIKSESESSADELI